MIADIFEILSMVTVNLLLAWSVGTLMGDYWKKPKDNY